MKPTRCTPLTSPLLMAGILSCLSVFIAWSHSGGLDSQGGHWDRKTGTYHYHRAPTMTPPSTAPPNVAAPSMDATAGSAGEAPWPKLNLNFPVTSSSKVIRVIDGDTVVLAIGAEEKTVRLIGVDTPETVHPSKPVEAYGKEASRFTENLLKGESVYLDYEPGGSRLDKYGRTLAYLYRVPDGVFVNLEIVRQGYGHAYTEYPFRYMEAFRFYERRARETGKGLWAPDTMTAKPLPASPAVAREPISAVGTEAGNDTVYITRTGTKYHSAGCRYLARSSIPIPRKDAIARGHTACSICNP